MYTAYVQTALVGSRRFSKNKTEKQPVEIHVLRACGDDVVCIRRRLLLMDDKAPEDVRLRGCRNSVEIKENKTNINKRVAIGAFRKMARKISPTNSKRLKLRPLYLKLVQTRQVSSSPLFVYTYFPRQDFLKFS